MGDIIAFGLFAVWTTLWILANVAIAIVSVMEWREKRRKKREEEQRAAWAKIDARLPDYSLPPLAEVPDKCVVCGDDAVKSDYFCVRHGNYGGEG